MVLSEIGKIAYATVELRRCRCDTEFRAQRAILDASESYVGVNLSRDGLRRDTATAFPRLFSSDADTSANGGPSPAIRRCRASDGHDRRTQVSAPTTMLSTWYLGVPLGRTTLLINWCGPGLYDYATRWTTILPWRTGCARC